ncbi:hypothetical protein [Arthrobacter nitrophenolicus]|uniref:Uncharacterized protein n=1 Tax=Arthrobacter nitrophenolicus TaxID=683150 RepID=L8TKE2_9MICC|nr:hypothetical protein [Arthrobacter nitrophenolicus]ELT43182.1 hypothetical protein G205_20058 [Arthrobacter nitrophenolicus]
MKISRFAAKSLAAATAVLLACSLAGCDVAANALEAIESAPRGAAVIPLRQIRLLPATPSTSCRPFR